MALLIKPDGSKEKVAPQETPLGFTPKEVGKILGGCSLMQMHQVRTDGYNFMLFDRHAERAGMPRNKPATQLVGEPIHGPVLLFMMAEFQ